MIRKHNQTSKKRKEIKAIIIILIIILLLLSIFFILKGTGLVGINIPGTTPIYLEDEERSIEGKAESADRDSIIEELKKQQLIVTDKLSSNITFPSGEAGTIGEWVVENPEENIVIIQAEVYLDDLLIAESTPIYPNQHITGVALLSKIEPGEYEVTAFLNYYDVETKEFISKAGYKIHLTIH